MVVKTEVSVARIGISRVILGGLRRGAGDGDNLPERIAIIIL